MCRLRLGVAFFDRGCKSFGALPTPNNHSAPTFFQTSDASERYFSLRPEVLRIGLSPDADPAVEVVRVSIVAADHAAVPWVVAVHVAGGVVVVEGTVRVAEHACHTQTVVRNGRSKGFLRQL